MTRFNTQIANAKSLRKKISQRGFVFYVFLFYCLLSIFLVIFACREKSPEPYVRTIELEALDVSCTEAWLKITLTDSKEPRTVMLVRDDSITVFSDL